MKAVALVVRSVQPREEETFLYNLPPLIYGVRACLRVDASRFRLRQRWGAQERLRPGSNCYSPRRIGDFIGKDKFQAFISEEKLVTKIGRFDRVSCLS